MIKIETAKNGFVVENEPEKKIIAKNLIEVL